MGFSLQSHDMFRDTVWRIRLTQAHYRVVYTYTGILEGIFQQLFLVKHLQKASIPIIPFVLIRNIGAVQIAYFSAKHSMFWMHQCAFARLKKRTKMEWMARSFCFRYIIKYAVCG